MTKDQLRFERDGLILLLRDVKAPKDIQEIKQRIDFLEEQLSTYDHD